MTVASTGTIRQMALLTDAQESLHPLTVDDYLRMVEIGILKEDEKVELLEGAIIAMSPEGKRHLLVASLCVEHVVRGLGDDSLIATIGSPIKVLPDSMPQPDIAVVDRSVVKAAKEYSQSAHLCIEVSFSSLRKDLDRKARIYARAGVREYWVVDLKARVVHVHLDPSRGSYAVRHEVAPPALLSPTYLSLPPLPLADLLSVD